MVKRVVDQKFADVIADWQKHLLQLDRRNNLLYFKQGKAAVHIIEQTPKNMLQQLQSSHKGLTFDYAEARSRISKDIFNQSPNNSDENQEPAIEVISGDLRGDCSTIDLQKRLNNLFKRSREWEEEQGLNILFIALGFLKWVDEDGENATAPLLLLPCQLKRSSRREPFTLIDNGEDIDVNSTLSVKVNDFGIILPEPDLENESIVDYLDRVRKLVHKRHNFEVTEDIYLATFAYSKLAMWKDLDLIKNNGTNHPIILSLAGSETPTENDKIDHATVSEIPDDMSGAKLDDILDVHDQFAVLPTDYSQLLAITHARSGSNLIIHGPPGTGKSQTIANIIATFLAEGKSVLFVSEKTAALDVVKRRLDQKQLGTFCLDLHSERGNKANVYQQLRLSVNDQRIVRRLEFDYETLAQRRDQLNKVVRIIHTIREPLGKTVFQVHGRFSTIRDVPDVRFKITHIEDLDPSRLSSILEAAHRLRLKPREFREHNTSHWKYMKEDIPSLELANTIRYDMRELKAAVRLEKSANQYSEILGLEPPDNIENINVLGHISRHLIICPGISESWLEVDRVGQLQGIAKSEAKSQSERTDLIEQLTPYWGNTIPNWDFVEIASQILTTPEERRRLTQILGEQWDEVVIKSNNYTSISLKELTEKIKSLINAYNDVQDFLQVKKEDSWASIQTSILTTRTVGTVGPVPNAWVEPKGISIVAALIENAKKIEKELKAKENKLFSEFDFNIVNTVDHEMFVRFRTDYQNRLRRFINARYKIDRNNLQVYRHTKGKISFATASEVVEETADLKNQQKLWGALETNLVTSLGTRYSGRDTGWDVIFQELQQVKKIIDESTKNKDHIVQLLSDNQCSIQAREIAEKLAKVYSEVQVLLESTLTPVLINQIQENKKTLSWLIQMLENTIMTVERIEKAIDVPLAASQKQIQGLQTLLQLIEVGKNIREIEREHSESKEQLQLFFGRRFQGFNTDWARIIECLEWTEALFTMIAPTEITPVLLSHIENPKAPREYEKIADSIVALQAQYKKRTEILMERYTLSEGPWDSWEKASFKQIELWAEELLNDADSASDWQIYRKTVKDIEKMIGISTVDVIRIETEDSELIPQIVERRVLGAWLDCIYQHEPLLANFVASEHDDLITKFKELDIQLTNTSQNEVRKRVFERYPNVNNISIRTNEMGILRGELSKKRQQWPIRRLLRKIPRLIQTIKPCVMVSPLAVSQYLPLSADEEETLKFDVVIFDEASQIFPEDAVPAILRGAQTILAGDQKQLPPSSFWRSSLTEDDTDFDEDDDNISTNQFTGRSSILDAAIGMVGRVFSEAHLNIHYRSKDESLIRFSNHYFYENRLLTFPSSGIKDSWSGIHDFFVPDGRYDAGGGRNNLVEAQRVVDLVFEHFRTRPFGESLGVVALSRAQSDLIERLIEERRILERDVDERFNEKPSEIFFVKNLENVQGDERDHMIISIGYGPTVESGAVPNRFGPLNTEGGERRLNVVISRARQRVDVVHSLKAGDIRSQQEGARLLRRYLEYAANPLQTFEGQITVNSNSETESPFEEAVAYALTKKGYKIDRQVGVAGYRIDLAILSEDGSKYDIGIECDGFTYHSTPAARDRDWLRQQVLEGLGWKLHRVWSTAWVRNPIAELDRIEAALTLARSEMFDTKNTFDTNSNQKESNDVSTDSDLVMVETVQPESAEIKLEEYKKTNMSLFNPLTDLKDEGNNILISIITQIARIEGPVHKDVVIERIRICYQLGKVMGTTREKVETAIRLAKKNNHVMGSGDFIWFEEEQINRPVRYPVDGNIEHISPIELKSVTLTVAKAMFGIPQNDLITEVARLLKFNRTGVRITEVIGKTIEDLLSEGLLVESFGMLHEKETEGNPSNNDKVISINGKSDNSHLTHNNLIKDNPSTLSLIQGLRTRGLEVVDNRPQGGYLWVVGGQNLWLKLKEFDLPEFYFQFVSSGSRATQNRSAWRIQNNILGLAQSK